VISCRRPVPTQEGQQVKQHQARSLCHQAPVSELSCRRKESRELVANVAAFFPDATFFKANNVRIAGVCDAQDSSLLEMLNKTSDMEFMKYLTSKC
jgi:hypothetical protein